MTELGGMRRGKYIKSLETAIQREARVMEAAIRRQDSERFARSSEDWRLAQMEWLQVARGMSLEKAIAVMVGLTMGDLTSWMVEKRPGPPPSVLGLYDGPISDEEFGKMKSLGKGEQV
jgi:hypothetical protein